MKRSLLITLLALVVTVPAALAEGGGTRISLKPAKAFPAAKGSAKFKATRRRSALSARLSSAATASAASASRESPQARP
jgi:hypothetical protein